MRRLLLSVLLVCVTAVASDAAPRRRAVSPRVPLDDSPETWLRLHAWPLATAELSPVRDDLAPLRNIIGEADVVALCEATHGTHEFHTMRIRIIDHLVRDLGFDVVAMEAPFPLVNRVNAYVRGESESPRAILLAAWNLGYYFWDVQEMLALFEWARAYNASRGERPLVEFAGADTYDHREAARAVIDYLRAVDPVEAAEVEANYQCVFSGTTSSFCGEDAGRVRSNFAARETELEAMTSPRAFDDALQNATVVQQYLTGGTYGTKRDEYLATNTLWIREHRGQSRRVIVWAHQVHVATVPIQWIANQPSMGQHLEAALGDEYVMIGTATRAGSFLQWQPARNDAPGISTATFSSSTAAGYESFFARGGSGILLIPLRGALPSWITKPNTLQNAPANPANVFTITGSLPEMMDAIIYFESTTPAVLP